MNRLSTLLIAMFALGPAHAWAADCAQPPKALKVLFVGNSLTAAYNIPGIVQALSTQDECLPKMEADFDIVPETDLQDHWNSGKALKKIRSTHFDFVVLQQGPTSTYSGRMSLLEFARKFSHEAAAQNTQTAIYMTWPPRGNQERFGDVVLNHRLVAKEIKAKLIPVGEVWRKLLQTKQPPQLYSPDDFHPSALGALLAAAVIYNSICDCELKQLPEKLTFPDQTLEVPAETARLFLETVQELKK
jgi:hypothetical protein